MADYQGRIAKLADHTCRPVCGVQYRFDCFFIENRLIAAGTFQFGPDVLPAFLFGQTVEIVVHNDPLTERFMVGKPKRVVDLRKTDKKDHCPVTGIHFEVKEDLQVIQDGIADIVGSWIAWKFSVLR